MKEDSRALWPRASALFDQALDLPPDQRAAFLDQACAADGELRRQVLELLEAADRAGGFLEDPLHSQSAAVLKQVADRLRSEMRSRSPESLETETAEAATSAASRPDPIGPYRLLQKIGEGGMGEVWQAGQDAPIRRQVAIKLIKAGMDTKQVVARFEAERQALALMDHPSIAKVYEAGETPRGLPYFAMEYVAGESITRYCDRHRLPTAERLALFGQVCAGVQHAHQKGIIHRDLKPSNVLVCIQDGKPVPKIIDFGVAKATAQRLTDRTMFTEVGVLIGTPEYMSPEQAEMTGLDIDTRTDVYALGVILYELLTGTLPFESKELRQAGLEEVRRRIRDVEPPRPSARVRTLGERSTPAASNRRTDPKRLVSRLKGDLDWIVMKAIEKDRTRRYGSPAELAADVTRHLEHQPVVAGPPGAGYRVGKFIRRHRLAVGVAALVVLGLVGFAAVMAAQAQRIARERDRAEKVSDFLVNLFEESNPGEARGSSITAREVLDRGVPSLERTLRDEPALQGQMMSIIGMVYRNLGLLATAEPLLTRAVALQTKALGPQSQDTLRTQGRLGAVYEKQARFAEADNLLQEVWEKQKRVLGPEHPDTLWTLGELGMVKMRLKQLPQAEACEREVLETRRRVHGSDHVDTLNALGMLGSVLEHEGHNAEAEAIDREILAGRRRVLGPDHPDTIWALNNLASAIRYQGRRSEAVEIYKEGFETFRRILGKDHPDTLYIEMNLASTLLESGRNEEALALYREVYEGRSRTFGPESGLAIRGLNNLAIALDETGHLQEAEAAYRKCLDLVPRAADMPDEFQYTARSNLAGLLLVQKRFDEADTLLSEALEGAERQLGPGSGATHTVLVQRACVNALRGRKKEALESLRQAVEGGYADTDELTQDHDLDSLRGDPEFDRLVAAARTNAGPDALKPH